MSNPYISQVTLPSGSVYDLKDQAISLIGKDVYDMFINENIQKEWGSFNNYIWHFTKNKQIHYKRFHTHSILSDKVSNDLKKRGMKFVGTTIIYSYLEAIGVLNNHEDKCFKGGNNV